MALTDAMVRNAKPKSYNLPDIKGLSLFVSPTGTKSWHFRFTLNGKRDRISLGQYPFLSLKEARQRCEDARFLVQNGTPPKVVPGTDSLAPSSVTFAEYAIHWQAWKLKKLGDAERRQSTAIQIQRSLKKDILPVLGEMPMNTITKQHTLKVQRQIEMRGALSVSEKVRSWLKEIFEMAVAEDIIEHNPAQHLALLALPGRRTLNNPFLKMDEMPEFMAALNRYNGQIQTKLGVRLLFLTGVRTGELRLARPEQFDLDKGLWIIPPENVKQLRPAVRKGKQAEIPPYIIPLSTQAIDIVKQLLALRHPAQPYLLCHRSDITHIISENTLNTAIKRIGFDGRLTGHGVRGTLSTALNELGYAEDWIEAQLSHTDKNQIRGTYNHAMYVEQRTQMMQDWADMLDKWETQRVAQLKKQTI